MSGVTSVSVSTTPPAEAPATPATPVERPDYIPEKFWKGNVEESAKVMAQSYAELERKQSSGGNSGEGTGSTAATPPATPATPSTPATPAAPTAEETAVSAAVESALSTAAGSANDLKATLEWARVNATPEQKALFDSALDSGNPALATLAFGQIKQAYTEAMGSQGTRVSGESVPTTTGAKPFASQHEIAAFVNSKAYKSGDPAAHKEYMERMKVTNW